MACINKTMRQTTVVNQFIILFALPLFLLSALLILNQKSSSAAPVAQIRARTVQGSLPGGAYAQIWLGLEPEVADAQITVLAEWDRLFPADNGLNFFIFDEQQLRRLGEGNNSFSALALAAGSANFALSTPDNVLGAGFRATGWAAYAIVMVNESADAATFTLRVTNGFVTDAAGQVTVLDPPQQPTPTPVNTVVVIMTPTPPVTATPFSTPTVITTDTISLSATNSPLATPTPSPLSPLRPEARTSLGRNKREVTIKGTLTTPTEQQLLRLKPNKAKDQLLFRLTVDGAETVTTGRASTLNFWVFDEEGFSQYLSGVAPATLALANGKPVFRSASNERVAGFRAVDTAPYTVVIYSNQATLPISYTLRIEGGQLLENTYLP